MIWYPEGKTTLWAIGLLGAATLAGCGEQGQADAQTANAAAAENQELDAADVDSVEMRPSAIRMRTGDPATDDVEFVYRLGLLRGHMAAFAELYRAGELEMASVHAKHPSDELYADLEPAFAARQSDGFDDALEVFMRQAADGSEIDDAYANLLTAISEETPSLNVPEKLLAVSLLVAEAAEEFDAGVAEDGAITKPQEYQDAYGFLTAAREMLAEDVSADINETEAIAVAHEQVDMAFSALPSLMAQFTEGDAATISQAASVIERAARRL